MLSEIDLSQPLTTYALSTVATVALSLLTDTRAFDEPWHTRPFPRVDEKPAEFMVTTMIEDMIHGCSAGRLNRETGTDIIVDTPGMAQWLMLTSWEFIVRYLDPIVHSIELVAAPGSALSVALGNIKRLRRTPPSLRAAGTILSILADCSNMLLDIAIRRLTPDNQ